MSRRTIRQGVLFLLGVWGMTEGLSIGAIVLAVVVWLLNEPLWEFLQGPLG